VYIVRAFITGQKPDRNGINRASLLSYPQVDVHPPSFPDADVRRPGFPQVDAHPSDSVDRNGINGPSLSSYPQVDAHPHPEEASKSLKASKDVSVLKVTSPGYVMFHVRNVVQSNASLSDQEKKAIVSAFGKAVFKREYLSRFQQQPVALRELLTLLMKPRPPGKPPQRAAVRCVYAWTFGLIASIVTKHELGIGSMVRRLQTQVTSEPTADPPRHRIGFRSARRMTYAERGKVPSWAR
jgi:hypothetical protein